MSLHRYLPFFRPAIIFLVLLVFVTPACNLTPLQLEATLLPTALPTNPPAAPVVEPTLPPSPAPTITPVLAATPIPTATPTGLPLPTEEIVQVTAITQNLNIRRGPGTGYNVIGILPKYYTSPAFGKDETGEWMLVLIPGRTDYYGWVTAKPPMVALMGPAYTLKIVTMDPPKDSFIRNCTYHVMQLSPGNIRVESRTKAPKNELLISPGEYSVYDLQVYTRDGKKHPLTQKVTVVEGETSDITTDGAPNHFSCDEP